MSSNWLEQELSSEAMMALGDLIRERPPYTLMTTTPHLKGFQELLDWGYIVCDADVVKIGATVTAVTPEGRRYYSELRLRMSALEREEQALGSAVSAARFTALAALVALIDPAQSIAETLLVGFGADEGCAKVVSALVGVLLLGCAACLGYRFYRSDAILRR